ncbi:MAG: pyridoxal 5'-phosphate synthase lyase subunit PdxS, partial [Calditrichaeota bacterium]|nr:pyridoxal 5'-phosphate synthase lyase subunit PdxS [Calditrichota bacterium]
SLMMQLGAEAVFVGSGIFKSEDPAERARAIVLATTHYLDFDIVAKASEGLKDAMKGLEISEIPEDQLLQKRGW